GSRGGAGAYPGPAGGVVARSRHPHPSFVCRPPPAVCRPSATVTAGPATWLVGVASRTFTAGPYGRLPVATRRD
ncbi:hypothetical protein ACFWB3_28855, partial [[Kitasatospora] papulosa]|uniref:hypothetical protein n=1 Tax=[Kitasatospora] papulosa TaxID=1464011 RepID=UPI0036BC5506